MANVFLEVLFHQLRLDYQVPIISQQGEVCGKLHVEVYRLGYENEDRRSSLSSESNELTSDYKNINPINPVDFLGSVIRCRVIYILLFFADFLGSHQKSIEFTSKFIPFRILSILIF